MIRALGARAEPPRLRGSRLELAVEGAFEVDLRDHDLDRRLALLDRDEIDVAVVSCPPTLGLDDDLLSIYHESIRDVVADAGGRLVALATGSVIDGFAGTCVAADDLLDLGRLAPLAEALAGRGFVFVHPGPAAAPHGAPPWWSAVVGYTAQMQAAYFAWLAGALPRWPELPVVFAILAGGAPFQLERLASRGGEAGAVPSVYLDTASYGRRELELSRFVAQLVYGSDAPVIDSRPTLRAVRELGLERELCVDNPSRLLGVRS